MTSQFIAPSHIGSVTLTSEQVVLQCEAMCAAVLQCIELDSIVCYSEMVTRVDLYLTTHGDDVSQRVMAEYVVRRGALVWLNGGEFPTSHHIVVH
jgi:hypothetical protein